MFNPENVYMPAEKPGHRLGTLVFSSQTSTYVFQLHEAMWADAVTYSGYAAPLDGVAINLIGFTATSSNLGLLNKLRPSINFDHMEWSLELPDLEEGTKKVTAEATAVTSPYLSADGKSPDSYLLSFTLEGITYRGSLTGVSEGFLGLLIVCGAIAVALAVVTLVDRAEAHSHQQEMERLRLLEKALDKGYDVEYTYDGATTGAGSGGSGSGSGSVSTSSGGSMHLTPPAASGGVASVSSASSTAGP